MLRLSVFMAASTLIACTPQQSEGSSNLVVDTDQPFEISVDDVKVIRKQQQIFQDNNLIQTDEYENRLLITVSINNITELELKKVWFELQLNSEVEPYIASGILKFKSDKMDITTREKALEADLKDKPNDKPIVWAFSHEWNMMLTTEENLDTYYGLSPEGLAEGLKSITVQVNWKGGLQTETISLELSESDLKLLK